MSAELITRREDTALAPMSDAAFMPVMTMNQAVNRYKVLVDYVKELMVKDKDFGTIPGTNKPCLYKPGAEKLGTLFGLTPQFVVADKAEDWTGVDHGGEPFFYYLYRCALYRGDRLIADADGSCNSWESKYRWRWVKEDELPTGIDTKRLQKRSGTISEYKFSIDKAETTGKYGKPPEYWQRFKDAIKNGTAIKIDKPMKNETRPGFAIESTMYRVPNEDIASQINTIQKMAQKRAYVAAILIGVNASEFFTQDLEDLDPGSIDIPLINVTEAAAPIVRAMANADEPDQGFPPEEPRREQQQTRPVAVKQEAPVDPNGYVNAEQATHIQGLFDKIVKAGYDEQALTDVVDANYHTRSLKHIKAEDYDDIVEQLAKALNAQLKNKKK